MDYIRTAEIITPKHPDKICDRISDAILDAYLEKDPDARVAVEVQAGSDAINIMGEVTSNAIVEILEIHNIARKIAETTQPYISINIKDQSPDIDKGVGTGGAGDQGIMIGYATAETKSKMPLEYELARELCQHLYEKYPVDGKTQITLNGKELIAVASFHNTTQKELTKATLRYLETRKDLKEYWPNIIANPAGEWKTGGLQADTGLTGRKIVADAYGPSIPVGGGAFSGKDATKVDRSAAYMARKIAVDQVNKGADEALVKLAYAIGQREPIQATIENSPKNLNQREIHGYDLTPQGIIKTLDLKKPQYEKTAEWGHFGREFTWDK